jgi:hypothetical protein
LELVDITNWLDKRKLRYSLDQQDENKTIITVQVRQRIDFKTFRLTIYKAEREFELLNISSQDTSYRSQFMIRTRFSYYKDVLKKLEQELGK